MQELGNKGMYVGVGEGARTLLQLCGAVQEVWFHMQAKRRFCVQCRGAIMLMSRGPAMGLHALVCLWG